jgi:hypothetical protein
LDDNHQQITREYLKMLDAVREHIAIYAFCMKGNDEAMPPPGEVWGGGEVSPPKSFRKNGAFVGK